MEEAKAGVSKAEIALKLMALGYGRKDAEAIARNAIEKYSAQRTVRAVGVSIFGLIVFVLGLVSALEGGFGLGWGVLATTLGPAIIIGQFR